MFVLNGSLFCVLGGVELPLFLLFDQGSVVSLNGLISWGFTLASDGFPAASRAAESESGGDMGAGQ